MKNLYTIVVILLCHYSVKAQKLGVPYLPTQKGNTPHWFKLFYDQEKLNATNIFELSNEVEKYKKAVVKENKKKALSHEIVTGEELEDEYILYFERWFKSQLQGNHIGSDGKLLSADSIHSLEMMALNKSLTNRPASINSPATTARSGSTWSLLGPKETVRPNTPNALPMPWQINIYSFAIAPTNDNVLYASAETGGIYKTTDKGLNWNMVYDGTSFTSMTVDPTNENIIYAGAGKVNYFLKSTNGGISWTVAFLPGVNGINGGIVVSPTNTNIILAGTNQGLYKSTDAGVTWTVVPGMNSMVYDVVMKPNDPTIIYCVRQVAGNNEFWKSTDGGNTFTQSMSGWTPFPSAGTKMATTITSPDIIYAIVIGSTYPSICSSTDSGSSWTVMGHPGIDIRQGFYNLGIAVNPNNVNQILFGMTSCFRSNDGGLTLSFVGGIGGGLPIHPDIQMIATKGNDTWISTDGGMSYSTNFIADAANLHARCNGLFGSDYWGFTQGWNEDIVGGGKYHNGNSAISEDFPAGLSMHFGGAEEATGYYMMGRPRHMAFSDMGARIIPNTINGAPVNFAFNLYPNEDGLGTDGASMRFLPYCYNHIFLGNGNVLYKSTDGGVSWTGLYDFGQRVKKFVISYSNPDIIYLVTASNLYKSTNGGTSFTLLGLPAGISVTRLNISIDHANENIIWISSRHSTAGNLIFKSTNGGAGWVNLTTPTINAIGPVLNTVHQAGTDGGVYASFGGRVFYRNNNLPDWVPYHDNYPIGSNSLHTIPFYRDGKLRTGSNRGVWQVDLYEPSVPIAQPTVDKLTTKCIRDTFYFDDYSVLSHQGATWAWTFSGTPSYVSSTSIRNPKVVFGAKGTYDYTLTVTNPYGTSTKTISGKIVIAVDECSPDSIPGKAVSLTGYITNDYVDIRGLNLTSNSFTFSCWIKPYGLQTNYSGIFMTQNGAWPFGLNFRANTTQLSFQHPSFAATLNTGLICPDGQWSHVALVSDPTGITIYCNGNLRKYNATNPIDVTVVDLFLGKFGRGIIGRQMVGEIDEVCFWNRALFADEIRQFRHLTKDKITDYTRNGLVAYYQFNETNSSFAYDKIGFKHAGLRGSGYSLPTSSAPVGGGVSQKIYVITSGVKNFDIPGVSMTFPTGTLPNGDLWVSKINQNPHTLPDAGVPTNCYWIVNNYAPNASFTPLAEIDFTGINNLLDGGFAQDLSLYKRGDNQFGNTWGSSIDVGDVKTGSGSTGHIIFNTGLSVNSFSQFAISGTLGVLPIQLQSFSAVRTLNNTSRVFWTCSNAVDFSGFIVERSIDGVNFERIHSVAYNGTSNYEVYDVNPFPRKNYYRLKLMNRNGTYTYSAIVLVVFDKANKLTVLPTVSNSGWFTLKNANASIYNPIDVCLRNSIGQTVRQFSITGLTDTQFYLPVAGAYFLSIRYSDGTVQSQKIIVE